MGCPLTSQHDMVQDCTCECTPGRGRKDRMHASLLHLVAGTHILNICYSCARNNHPEPYMTLSTAE